MQMTRRGANLVESNRPLVGRGIIFLLGVHQNAERLLGLVKVKPLMDMPNHDAPEKKTYLSTASTSNPGMQSIPAMINQLPKKLQLKPTNTSTICTHNCLTFPSNTTPPGTSSPPYAATSLRANKPVMTVAATPPTQ
ncbi:hypothetical protein QC762_0096520 [Podospora pseudocomata]|uniref:Uncharacterized protein n=1 Tax=Podospora pseudocomata TaxID=2093779 RepID=A0ABR0G7S2_9PEZI|nr:hypothetical protein QC762_0096520 [Podospora pseudocomata]